MHLRLDGLPPVSQVPTDGQHFVPSPQIGQSVGDDGDVGGGVDVGGLPPPPPPPSPGQFVAMWHTFFPLPQLVPAAMHTSSLPTTVPDRQISSPGSFLAHIYLLTGGTGGPVGEREGTIVGDLVGVRLGGTGGPVGEREGDLVGDLVGSRLGLVDGAVVVGSTGPFATSYVTLISSGAVHVPPK